MTCKFRHDKMNQSLLITTTWLCVDCIDVFCMSNLCYWLGSRPQATYCMHFWYPNDCLLQLQHPATVKIFKPSQSVSYFFIHLSSSVRLQQILCPLCFCLPLSCINASICSSVSLSLQSLWNVAAHQSPSASCSWFSTVDSSTELSFPGRVQRQLVPPKCVFLWAGLCWHHCVLYVTTVHLLWIKRLVVESPISFSFLFFPVSVSLCLIREIPIDTNTAAF